MQRWPSTRRSSIAEPRLTLASLPVLFNILAPSFRPLCYHTAVLLKFAHMGCGSSTAAGGSRAESKVTATAAPALAPPSPTPQQVSTPVAAKAEAAPAVASVPLPLESHPDAPMSAVRTAPHSALALLQRNGRAASLAAVAIQRLQCSNQSADGVAPIAHPLVRMCLEHPGRKLSPAESLTVLTSCIAQGKEQAMRAKDKDLLLFLGNTGTHALRQIHWRGRTDALLADVAFCLIYSAAGVRGW